MAMTSRERVRAVLDHKMPDRIPNGLGGCETAGMHVVLYDTLQKLLGVNAVAPRLDTFMTNAVFEAETIAAMEGDILLLASPRMCKTHLRGKGSLSHWKEQTLWGRSFRVPKADVFTSREDGSVVWETCGHTVCPPGSYFFDALESTDLTAAFDFPSPEDFHPPHDFPEELLRHLEDTAKALYNETELSLCLGETITDLQVAPGGMIGVMVYMMEEPEQMKAFLQKSVDAGLAQLKLLDQAVGKYVDMLSIAHDFGDNRSVTIGERLWREIYKPYYMQLFQGWRKTTSMKINFHSCGAVHSILGDLIECGLQVFNPVQISSQGMNPSKLKADFGKDLVFFGGAYDSQLNPPSDSYETVYARAKETIAALGQGGGYLFAGVHNLPPEVPEAHLRGLLDAYRDGRDYPQ